MEPTSALGMLYLLNLSACFTDGCQCPLPPFSFPPGTPPTGGRPLNSDAADDGPGAAAIAGAVITVVVVVAVVVVVVVIWRRRWRKR